MKMFSITRMRNGEPDIDVPVAGWVHCDSIGQWGAYLFAGTKEQLEALSALPQVIPIVAVTEKGDAKWPELEAVIDKTSKVKLDSWLSTQSVAAVSEKATSRDVVTELYKRFNGKFDLGGFDVADELPVKEVDLGIKEYDGPVFG